MKAAPVALLCSALLQLVACSGDDGEENSASDGKGGNSSVVISGGSTGLAPGTGGGAVVVGDGTTCTIEDDGSDCVGQAFEGESIPLDIYIMFDQSGSMCSCVDPADVMSQVCPDPACDATRLDAVREATRLFLDDPQSAGISIGLGYFGKQPIGSASCEVADYTDAAVGFGVLPDHAGAINGSLAQILPTGETPTGPAIRGACEYASAHKQENPGHEVVILLLTDGKPEAPVTCAGGGGPCCPTLDDAVDAATACREGESGIKTYVLGVGPLLQNLNEIAAAGGTDEAYLVEGGDVSAQVLDALSRIRGDAIPCELQLPTPPDGTELVYGQVNITYASPSCEPTYYYNVETIDLCGADGGWYYDDPNAPQKIQLCPTSCDQVSVPGGKLLYTVGCATREIPK